jgi:hypothetical protein
MERVRVHITRTSMGVSGTLHEAGLTYGCKRKPVGGWQTCSTVRDFGRFAAKRLGEVME